MITTGSDGTPLSAAFATAVAQPIVSYDAQLWTEGSQLSCTIRRIALALGSTGDSSGSDGVQVGGCWSARMEASLHGCSANVSGSELELRIGVDVGGSYEYVTVATVTVTSAQRSGDELAILAYGRIATWLSVPLGLAEGDYAASALASSIAQASGTSVTLGSFASTTQTVHVLAGWTCRDALAALATRLGGFAAEDGDGSVHVVPLGGSPTFAADNMRLLPLLAEADWEADGLTVTPLEGAPFVYGTGRVHVEDDFATQATASITWGNLDGIAFRPGTLSLSTLDPRVTPFDVAGVADGNDTLAVPAMGITATYDGGWWGSMSAPGMGEVAEDAAYEGPVLQRVRKAQSEAVSAGSAAAAAQQAAEDAAEMATSYITELTDGIMVHPDGDSTTGWSIRSALELLKGGTSYIKAWLDGNVPKVRVGLESAAHILMTGTASKFYASDGTTQVAEIGLVPNTTDARMWLGDARRNITSSRSSSTDDGVTTYTDVIGVSSYGVNNGNEAQVDITSHGTSGTTTLRVNSKEQSGATVDVNPTSVWIDQGVDVHVEGALYIGTALGVSSGGTGQTSLQATRNAMGLGNTTGELPIANGGTGSTGVSKTTTASSIIEAATGFTLGSVSYAEWGKVAQLSVQVKGFAASSGSQTAGTVVSGKRPVYAVYATAITSSNAPYASLDTDGTLSVYWSSAPGTSTNYVIRFVYLLA